MTTTKRLLILIALIVPAITGNAQIETVANLEGIEILGMRQLEPGPVLLSSGDSRNKLKIDHFNNNGQHVWSSTIDLPSVHGYDKNHCTVEGDDESIYVIYSIKDKVTITGVKTSNGDPLSPPYQIKLAHDDLKWQVHDGQLYSIIPDNDRMIMAHATPDGLTSPVTVSTIDERYNRIYFRPIAKSSEFVISSSYTLEPNHGKIHLFFEHFNISTSEQKVLETDLELDHTSFTYNSSVDKRVFGVYEGDDHFYLVGKLDIKFKNTYPTTKHGDNFIGIWVAKFSYDLDLQYFSEIPFQYFEGYVPANVIQKPSVVALKEDLNDGLFVNINELKSILYGNTYITYLDTAGLYRNMVSGMDEYNVLEYDLTGLRDAGRKNKVRLMSDDWSPYSTMFFNLIESRPQDYSPIAEQVIRMSDQSKVRMNEKKSYNYLLYDHHALLFEYTTQRKGTLNVYRLAY